MSGTASASMTKLNISLWYGGGDEYTQEYASDMLFSIYAPNGKCMQIGGFSGYDKNCFFAAYWPADWISYTAGIL